MPFHQGLTRAQGDPGFFSFLGKIAKTAVGIGTGLITGRIPQQIGQAVQQVFAPPTPLVRPQVPGVALQPTAMQLGIAPGAPALCPPGGGCPSGFRPNKSAYFLKDGTFVMPGSRCVRVRRINPANGRAVRRAIRRENAFIGMAVKTGLVKAPRAARVRKAAGRSRR